MLDLSWWFKFFFLCHFSADSQTQTILPLPTTVLSWWCRPSLLYLFRLDTEMSGKKVMLSLILLTHCLSACRQHILSSDSQAWRPHWGPLFILHNLRKKHTHNPQLSRRKPADSKQSLASLWLILTKIFQRQLKCRLIRHKCFKQWLLQSQVYHFIDVQMEVSNY